MSRLACRLAILSSVLLAACPMDPSCEEEGGCYGDDAGKVPVLDGGGWDAAVPPQDASVPDASVEDASVADASVEDASVPDAASWDASYPQDPCSSSATVTGGLRVAVLDVGQGDAIAVIAPSGCAALIDSGPGGSGATIQSYFRAHDVGEVSWVVVSHYHNDHLGGLDEVEDGWDAVPIETFYDRGEGSSAVYAKYAAEFSGRRQHLSVGQSLTLCDEVCFRVVAANGDGSTDDENALSVALKLIYGEFSMLLGGDLTGAMELTIKDALGELDVYKVHHHGSKTSSVMEFLAATKPTVSIVSAGAYNNFDHPAAEALARLAVVGSSVWRTEEWTHPVGNVEIEVENATGYRVTQAGNSTSYSIKAAP